MHVYTYTHTCITRIYAIACEAAARALGTFVYARANTVYSRTLVCVCARGVIGYVCEQHNLYVSTAAAATTALLPLPGLASISSRTTQRARAKEKGARERERERARKTERSGNNEERVRASEALERRKSLGCLLSRPARSLGQNEALARAFSASREL